MSRFPNIRIFTPNAHPGLAVSIGDYIDVPIGQSETAYFSDGEIFVRIKDNVRGADVYVIQPIISEVNRHLMELLIMVDALRRSSASKITAVVPYYAYGRQDRKTEPRVPITAKLVANLMTVSGLDRVVAMDLHAGQIQGFFDIPVDHLYSMPVIVEYFQKKALPDMMIVSPDAGGTERARALAKRLNTSLAIIDKRRTGPNVAEIMHLIGDVSGKNCLIIDDMVDTAGTLTKAAQALVNHGAKGVYAAATHGVLSGPAIERIAASPITELIITDTIPLPPEKNIEKIKVLSVAKLLGEAIIRIHQNTSVSSLFI